MSEGAEAFLDQLITWRELGFNMCAFQSDYDRYESLPQWARDDLQLHASDRRPALYSLEQFETAETHDTLWNAAQRQLIEEGRIHNYLRMLWGKKILEWSASPREALAIMIELNNKYALDGQRPQFLFGHLLDPGTLRSSLGADPARLWKDPLHELGEHLAEIEGAGVSCPIRLNASRQPCLPVIRASRALLCIQCAGD